MSNPIKHHYLPEFYLRAWCNEDAEVLEYSRPHSSLACKRRAPSATGYQRELYAIKSRTDPALRQELERRFMAYVDWVAAAAMQALLRCPPAPLDARLRDGWSRFLMSMIHRTPRRIQWLINKLKEQEEQAMADIRRAYERERSYAHPQTFEEYWKSAHSSTVFDECFANLLQQIIDSQPVGSALNFMHWRFGTLRGHRLTFLTSDAPVIMSKGFGGESGFLVLPISPTTVFVAANRPELAASFLARKSDELAESVNDAIIRRAEYLVIASDRSNEAFINDRLLRPDKPPVSQFLGIPVWHEPCEY